MGREAPVELVWLVLATGCLLAFDKMLLAFVILKIGLELSDLLLLLFICLFN